MIPALATNSDIQPPMAILQTDYIHNKFMECLSNADLLLVNNSNIIVLDMSNLFEKIADFIQSANSDSNLKRILLNEQISKGGDFFNQKVAITYIQKILKEEQSKKETPFHLVQN